MVSKQIVRIRSVRVEPDNTARPNQYPQSQPAPSVREKLVLHFAVKYDPTIINLTPIAWFVLII